MKWSLGGWSLLCRVERSNRDEPVSEETLALLSHELRNPLNAAVNAVYLLRLRDLQPPQERPVALLEAALAQCRALVDDLTDMSRLSRCQVSLRYVSLDLRALLRDLLPPFERAADQKGLALAVNLPAAPLQVFGDPVRLTQVFNNLIGNALKYTDTGHVWVTAAPCDGSAWVAVKDTGMGIDPVSINHLFQPFVQQAERGGLGLGLFVAKGFVELHGGSVTAASDGPGRGTLLTVELPLEAGIRPRETE